MNSNQLASSFIFINSADRKYGSSSDFEVSIKDLDATNNSKNISIGELVIPFSFFATVNENNNTFLINSLPVTLAFGNYTSADFITEITSKLQAATSDTFTCQVIRSTNQLKIAATSSTDYTITSNQKNYRYLGMNKSSTKAFSGNTFTSDFPIDLSGTKYIEIVTNIPIASTNSRDNNRNILTRVYVNCNPFEFIHYTSSSFQFMKLLTKTLDSISIRLNDDFGDKIDLNNGEIHMMLEVQEYT